MSKKTKKCRIFKDGSSWCCVGPKFKNLQESASGFGDTPEESYTDYQADVTAMKAAKKLVKSAKKAKKELKQSLKDVAVGDVKPLDDFMTELGGKKTAAKKAKKLGKVMAARRDNITEHAKVCFICGQTPSQVLTSALAFNLTLELPLGDNDIIALVAEVGDLKSWIGEVGSTAKKKVKAATKKPSRMGRLNKKIVKAFKNGTNRAGVLNLALIKNSKFNTPLPAAEVTGLVRVEWERLNPPSK